MLILHLERCFCLKIKKKYRKFKRGFYVYVGSGKRYGFQRIIRHLKRSKKLRWHIDYLLEKGKIERILIILGEGTNECQLSSILNEKGIVLMKKFGSSDCKCLSHLFYFKNNPYRIIEYSVIQSISKIY